MWSALLGVKPSDREIPRVWNGAFLECVKEEVAAEGVGSARCQHVVDSVPSMGLVCMGIDMTQNGRQWSMRTGGKLAWTFHARSILKSVSSGRTSSGAWIPFGNVYLLYMQPSVTEVAVAAVVVVRQLRETQLAWLLNTVVGETESNPLEQRLRYTQGFHDVASVLLLCAGEEAALPLLRRVGRWHLRYCTGTRLDSTGRVLESIWYLLQRRDPLLEQTLQGAGIPAAFTLPWVLTWFAHAVPSLDTMEQLFTVFLGSHPSLPLYLAAEVILHYRQPLLEAGEADMNALLSECHSILREPTELPWMSLLARALALQRAVPPHRLAPGGDAELGVWGPLLLQWPVTHLCRRPLATSPDEWEQGFGFPVWGLSGNWPGGECIVRVAKTRLEPAKLRALAAGNGCANADKRLSPWFVVWTLDDVVTRTAKVGLFLAVWALTTFLAILSGLQAEGSI